MFVIPLFYLLLPVHSQVVIETCVLMELQSCMPAKQSIGQVTFKHSV